MEAGRLIFEKLPTRVRPSWAARILRLVLERSGVQFSPIEHVLHLADNAAEWGDAHRAFSTLRDSMLELDELDRTQGLADDQKLLRWLLSLAELVAKVIYNATDPPDEFDEDSGWWIAACLRGFVDFWNDEKFSKTAWSALCNR